MFGHQHYFPVLRAKPAELRALRDLNPVLRSLTTPILECPPRVLRGCDTTAKLEQRLEHVAEHLASWKGRSVFLDFNMLRSATPEALEIIAARTARLGIRPVLVISLKGGAQSPYANSVRAVLAKHGSGICLRVSPEELKLSAANEMIDACLKAYSVSPVLVDLVIDRGGVDSGSLRYQEFAHHIPFVASWRTLTVLAGSFPPDLSRLARGSVNRLRRSEWHQWQELESWPGRRPAFGDYTIQHVLHREPVAVPNFSASVRYTIEEDFFVLRGEGVLNEGGPGYGQWNAWAALLIERPEFFGAAFSAGDGYIAERAANWSNTGSAQSWLQAGFSHHLTTTALQVANQLEQVRRLAASSIGTNWSSLVDIGPPEAVV